MAVFFTTRGAGARLSGLKDYRTFAKRQRDRKPEAYLVRADGSVAPLYIVNPLNQTLPAQCLNNINKAIDTL